MTKVDILTMDETWKLIEQTMNANPTSFQNENIRYEFLLTGEEASDRQLILANGTATVTDDLTIDVNCKLKLNTKDFKKLITGDLNSTSAFMIGKLKVDGSLGLALKLEGLLKEYVFEG